MQQLNLNLGIPDKMDNLPSLTNYSPDWEVEQDNTPFEGDRVLWNGHEAVVTKVYKRGNKCRINTTKAVLTVPINELILLTETVVVPVDVGHKVEIAQSVRDYVGRQDPLPTEKCPSDGHFPTEFKQSLEGMETDTLYRLKDLIEGEIEKRSKNLCRETGDSDRCLPTKKDVGRNNDPNSLPTKIDKDYPHPYIEKKKLPYETKTGRKYRQAYYLRDHHNKGKSKYICSKIESIPEEYRELKVYGDEIPF